MERCSGACSEGSSGACITERGCGRSCHHVQSPCRSGAHVLRAAGPAACLQGRCPARRGVTHSNCAHRMIAFLPGHRQPRHRDSGRRAGLQDGGSKAEAAPWEGGTSAGPGPDCTVAGRDGERRAPVVTAGCPGCFLASCRCTHPPCAQSSGCAHTRTHTHTHTHTHTL